MSRLKGNNGFQTVPCSDNKNVHPGYKTFGLWLDMPSDDDVVLTLKYIYTICDMSYLG